MKKIALHLFMSLIIVNGLNAQSVVGMWEMTLVTVGDQEMTPTAKWTNILRDGTYTSGNGWLQNAAGTWTFDEKTQTFLPKEINGIKDPFGAFAVSFEGNEMRWTRDEEGMKVTVFLTRVDKKPMAPADKIVGVWGLRQERETYHSPYYFFRWDRIYRNGNGAGERSTGYWHMHGHRPEITLLSHEDGKTTETWQVSFQEGMLTLIGLSDSNLDVTLNFERLDFIPQ